MDDNQWIPVAVAAITMLGVLAASFLRDRSNPMAQVVASAVANTVSLSAQLRYHEARARHLEAYAALLRLQLLELGVEPIVEPPMDTHL